MRRIGTLLILAAPLVFAEVGLGLLPWAAGQRLRGLIYSPPAVTRARYEDYIETREPVTGWPKRRWADRGRTIPRVSPAFPNADSWCVTLYGDSMTYGAEVSDDEAWGNVLAQRLRCPVGNFGAGGYGTDQALLRFIGNNEDHAAVTVVGIYADNPLRNVNQYRYFLSGGEGLGMKPRFVLEGGELKLIPLPTLSYEQFTRALVEPGEMFLYETFLPGSLHGLVRWTFPYTVSLLRLLRSEPVSSYLRGQPSWISFYDPADESRALPITVAIVEEFRRARSHRAIVAVLFPTPASYNISHGGVSALHPLSEQLEAHGVPTRDLTTDFGVHLGDRSICELVTDRATCTGHFNAAGNRVIAEAVERFLVAGKLIDAK